VNISQAGEIQLIADSMSLVPSEVPLVNPDTRISILIAEPSVTAWASGEIEMVTVALRITAIDNKKKPAQARFL